MREWLIKARKKLGMSQQEVANASGISQSYYASIENGSRGKPLNANVAQKIAITLKFDWTLFYR